MLKIICSSHQSNSLFVFQFDYFFEFIKHNYIYIIKIQHNVFQPCILESF